MRYYVFMSSRIISKAQYFLVIATFVLLFYPLRSLAAGGCDGAGNCYIRVGAGGSGTGANWTNAFSGFGTGAGKVNPSSMMRGVTYWIANGNYGGVTFNTPDSGTSPITLEGATAGNHGPAADWSSGYAGQAVFSESSVSTDYWTINGQTRGSNWQSGYTIKFWNQSDPSGAALFVGGNSNVSIEYVELEGTGAGFPNNTGTSDRCSSDGCGEWGDAAIYESAPVSSLYVGASYAHNTGNGQFQMNVTGSNLSVNNNLTFEYNWISYNHTGQNGIHDQSYQIYANNLTIRNNVFQDDSGTAEISTAGAAVPSMSNWAVYGNLFFWDATYAALNGQYGNATIDNGVLDFLGEKMSGYIDFYNNTMAGFNNAAVTGSGAFATNAVAGDPGWSVCGASCPTVRISNNLWWDSAWVSGDYPNYCQVVTQASCTQDYDAFYNGSVPSGAMSPPSEAHGYVVNGSTNPFANAFASTIAGFEPVTPDPFASDAGIGLASPYNIDMLGVTRGADGTWDRGALQSQ